MSIDELFTRDVQVSINMLPINWLIEAISFSSILIIINYTFLFIVMVYQEFYILFDYTFMHQTLCLEFLVT